MALIEYVFVVSDLLHLAPNSAEAKMFEGLAKAEYNNSARVSKGN